MSDIKESEREIKVGDFITISEWNERNGHIDRSYVGDIFEVKFIETPFIQVFNHTDNIIKNKTLDLRVLKIQFLSAEFVKTVLDTRFDGDVEFDDIIE